ncbi:hypothetical protein D6D23_04064 [Aureobasidium pullulans]|nr:hypothetical protein D6D23_04064 [Aureobasidium pullulans]
MHESDPYLWTSREAAEFLRGSQLSTLADQLLANDLNGRMLLEDVNLSLLKEEFDILGLRERIGIMQVVRTLRSSSAGYVASTRPTALPSLLTPHTSRPSTPIEPTGARIRKGEDLVEDTGGRKRRRLTLVPFLDGDTQPGALDETPQPKAVNALDATQLKHADTATDTPTGYLPDTKLSVDDLFYGNTNYGSEIQHAEDQDNNSDDNFTIFGSSQFPGNASFVSTRLKHFLRADPEPVLYHQHSALAIYPYPEHMIKDKDTRSVTVFEPFHGQIKVIRERAQTLPFQKNEIIDTQVSPGEFSYLLTNHRGTDEILPAYGESECGSDSGQESSGDVDDSENGSDDDMAEEDSAIEAPNLSRELVLSLIDKVIDAQAQAWRANQQPKLDKSKANSVWRFVKGNKKTARALTEQAAKAIERLNARLERLKDNLADRTWDTEEEIKQSCLSLEPTVSDREYEEWRIRIWALKKEPPSALRHRKLFTKGQQGLPTGALDDQTSNNEMQDFVVEDDNFEDARESLSEDGHDSDANTQESPSPSAAKNEAASPINFDEDTTMTVDEDIAATADDSVPDALEIPADLEHDEEPRHQLDENASSRPSAETLEENVQTPKSNKFVANLQDDPDSPALPSLSPLFRSHRSTASKGRREVITISSSPTRPTATSEMLQPGALERPIKGEPQEIVYSDNPDNDPLTEIMRWKYEDLEENEDRRRLLIKMIFNLKNETRDPLYPLFTGNMTTCLTKIRTALSAINKGREAFSGYNEEESKAMQHAARLYLCYVHSNHLLFSAPLEGLASFGYEWPWEGDADGYADDLRRWHGFILKALQRVKKAYATGEVAVIEISDDEEDVPADINKDKPGHSSARKKTVAQDQGAVRKRANALERAALYESQKQNSQTTSFMAGEDGESIVPLYAPEDVDPSKWVHLNPDIAKRLKPHQIEGVKFMWREITAPVDEDGQGCLLAHTMGLGKTAQSLALLTAVAETAKDDEKRDALPSDLKKAKNRLRALILCPPSLLANWKQEIKMWCPKNLFNVFCLSSDLPGKALRLDELRNWRRYGGIMLCGYTMFARSINGKPTKLQPFTEEEQEAVEKILLEKPHIVVADEVHSIKSDISKSSLAAHKIKTHRRIGLTGSPMSNNTSEIFALIDWVAPKFLGNKVEFKAHYQEPIEAGTYLDSNKAEIRKSMTKLAALKRIISPKLNRADITVLKGSLKSKVEFVLTIPLTEPQKLGYAAYVREILRGKAGEEGSTISQVKLFGWLSILQLLCNHPVVFRRKLLEPITTGKKGKKATLTAADTEVVEDTLTAGSSTAPSSTAIAVSGTARLREGQSPANEEDAAYADVHISQYDINKAIVDALLEVVPDDDSIELSYKTLLVRKIMGLSIEAGDKVLIFSQSIPSLNFLDKMLTSMGLRYGRIQGDVAQEKREKVLKAMSNNKLDVLLISTRAGGLGLNIQQANRVIIFDYSFNPTWEEQAIGRSYRLGQTKPVFVYRFVAGGTFEFGLYDKQLFKTGLSSRVVDKKNPMRNANKKPAEWMKPPFDVPQQDINAEAGKDENVMDKIIASQRGGHDEFIRSIKTMETLMGESKDEALTAEEMQEVENEVLLAQTRKISGFENRTTLAPPPPPGFGPNEPLPYNLGMNFTLPGFGTPPSITQPGFRAGSQKRLNAQQQQQAVPAAHERHARQTLSSEPTDLTKSPPTPGKRIVTRY